MAPSGGERWVEVSPSQFTHETEGLALVRNLLPDESPFRAWSNFEFRDSRGKWHEVDLLVLGRGRLHLVELKYYSGTLRGDDHTWLRDGHRAEQSPLKLARRKAQYLATKLTDALFDWAKEKQVAIKDPKLIVPFIQESVFLHHQGFRCDLPSSSAMGLYGIDGHESTSHLPGISDLLLEQPHKTAIGPNQEAILRELMAKTDYYEPNSAQYVGARVGGRVAMYVAPGYIYWTSPKWTENLSPQMIPGGLGGGEQHKGRWYGLSTFRQRGPSSDPSFEELKAPCPVCFLVPAVSGACGCD